MNNNGLAKFSIVLSVLAILAVILMAFAFSAYNFRNRLSAYSVYSTSSQPQLSTISITATGSAYAQPNEVILYITANSTQTTASAATSNLSIELSEINATIMPYVNSNSSAINTESYSLQRIQSCYPEPIPMNSIQSQYVYTKCVYTNYSATSELKATLPVSNASSVLYSLSNIKDVYISNVQASLSNSQLLSLQSMALQRALQNATSQAQELNGGMSVTAENITVINSYYLPSPIISIEALTSAAKGNALFYPKSMGTIKTIEVQFKSNPVYFTGK
jgi:uncharacterized protein YggE